MTSYMNDVGLHFKQCSVQIRQSWCTQVLQLAAGGISE